MLTALVQLGIPLQKIYMITQFPKDCTLIEWSEEQQVFYINTVTNGKLEKRTNTNILMVVHICDNYKIAFMIIEYMEKYVVKKSPKPITTYQMTAHIKALTKFSKSYCKQNKLAV